MNILEKFVRDFVGIVERHAEYIVVSGFVAISHGRSRGTEDVDIIVRRISFEKFDELNKDLAENGFKCLQSDDTEILYDYLINGDSIRYIRKGEYLPEMEFKFAKDELDDFQFSTKTKLPLSGMADIWFSNIEMNVAFKEELLKTEKDLADAEHLRIVYEEELDERLIDEIKEMIRRFRLSG